MCVCVCVEARGQGSACPCAPSWLMNVTAIYPRGVLSGFVYKLTFLLDICTFFFRHEQTNVTWSSQKLRLEPTRHQKFQAQKATESPQAMVLRRCRGQGHKDGIFIKWKNVKAQVEGYPDNLHKKFDNFPDSVKWYNENRRCPRSVRTPFPPHDNTPLPPLQIQPPVRRTTH